MSLLDKNREFCAQKMLEDPFNAPKWEMVRRWANEDCNRELIAGYPFKYVKWWNEIGEWICFDERDRPVLEVVAGTLLVCGDEPRTERLMKEGGRVDLDQRLLCEVWEEIITGADNLIENGWKPEPAPPPLTNAKPPKPAPLPDEGYEKGRQDGIMEVYDRDRKNLEKGQQFAETSQGKKKREKAELIDRICECYYTGKYSSWENAAKAAAKQLGMQINARSRGEQARQAYSDWLDARKAKERGERQP